jgi:hypothetical protein
MRFTGLNRHRLPTFVYGIFRFDTNPLRVCTEIPRNSAAWVTLSNLTSEFIVVLLSSGIYQWEVGNKVGGESFLKGEGREKLFFLVFLVLAFLYEGD